MHCIIGARDACRRLYRTYGCKPKLPVPIPLCSTLSLATKSTVHHIAFVPFAEANAAAAAWRRLLALAFRFTKRVRSATCSLLLQLGGTTADSTQAQPARSVAMMMIGRTDATPLCLNWKQPPRPWPFALPPARRLHCASTHPTLIQRSGCGDGGVDILFLFLPDRSPRRMAVEV